VMELHRRMLPESRRRRGEIDVDLVVALAKLEDSETVEQAAALLTSREMMALLSDRRGFELLTARWKKQHGRAA
jgi:membrane glycosyltransferase